MVAAINLPCGGHDNLRGAMGAALRRAMANIPPLRISSPPTKTVLRTVGALNGDHMYSQVIFVTYLSTATDYFEPLNIYLNSVIFAAPLFRPFGEYDQISRSRKCRMINGGLLHSIRIQFGIKNYLRNPTCEISFVF